MPDDATAAPANDGPSPTVAARTATPLDSRTLVAGDRLRGQPLLLLLDVDGTLAPIVARPQDARVPDDARATVARLVALPGTHVALVSGRGAADARRVADVAGVWISGSHGAELVRPADGVVTVHPALLPHEASLARAAARLTDLVAALPGVLLEDKRWTLSAHYRQAPDIATVTALRTLVDAVATRENLHVSEGKLVFELRAPAGVDKGTAVLQLARALGATAPGASVLFAGDDTSDEDAFRALRITVPQAITIRIGAPDEPTAAEFVAAAPADIHALLAALHAALASSSIPVPRARLS